MNRLNEIEAANFVSMMYSLLLEALPSGVNLSSLQLVLWHVAVIKSLPVHLLIADLINTGPLGSLGLF